MLVILKLEFSAVGTKKPIILSIVMLLTFTARDEALANVLKDVCKERKLSPSAKPSSSGSRVSLSSSISSPQLRGGRNCSTNQPKLYTAISGLLSPRELLDFAVCLLLSAYEARYITLYYSEHYHWCPCSRLIAGDDHSCRD